MADLEREIQNHYNLTTVFPSEWPAEKDLSSDEEEVVVAPAPQRNISTRDARRKSRFYALERSASNKSFVPGAERGKDGIENLVQRDEADPLGAYSSVVSVLRQRGLPVEDDLKLRNRFLLSSTSFNPSSFLSQVHSDADTDTLLQGLDFLSRSIEKKSASLKVLVESNFERFVRAKSTIDNVYANMRDQGKEPEPTQRRPHSRHTSRGGHSRGPSGLFSPGINTSKSPVNDKRKNALIKESEYGVLGIKAPLLDVAVKADEVWGPALGGREKEEALKAILTTVERHRAIFEVGPSVRDAIKKKDHETLVEDYVRARRFADEARVLVENSTANRMQISDDDTYRVLVTARMWSDVEEQISAFKRDVWKKLAGTHFTKQATPEDDTPEAHMSLINILLELGVDDNPIWVWLASRYDFLKNKILSSTDRAKVEIEILRRKLGNGDKPSAKSIAEHLRSAHTLERSGGTPDLDSAKVLEFWKYLHESMSALLSTRNGILGEVIEFWETAKSFIDGQAASRLPVGLDGKSKQHHRLSTDGVRDLRGGAGELVNLIREYILSFFTDPPIEDISLLFSPLPPTPDSPRTPNSAANLLSPRSATRFKFDPNDVPPPSPRRGEAWEQYAFWAPHSNALSGSEYLSKILALIGTAASEMAGLSVIRESPEGTEQMKTLVGAVRESSVKAVCAAWASDSENCILLEDWARVPERREMTQMPNRFMSFQTFVLTHLQKLMYISEASIKSGSEVIVPPPQKLIATARSQFMGSLYKTFSGMVETAEGSKQGQNGGQLDVDGITVPAKGSSSDMSSATIDASKRNVRILLTLSNLQSLRNEIVPQLTTQFETNFTITMTDEIAQLRDVLGQIDARLFQSYVKPICKKIEQIVHAGIASPEWGPKTSNLTDASPYVHTVLLQLVIVHTEVSTTASSLTTAVLKHMLEHLSQCLIDAIKQRSKYDLPLLMQATLDVEFLAQTLSSYTTDKASQVQSNIYLVLDERADNDARKRLQGELPALKNDLKRLKEKTKGEFACFKRQRQRNE